MAEADFARRILLEREEAARAAERSLVNRLVAALNADNINPTYKAAYVRVIKKIRSLVDFQIS